MPNQITVALSKWMLIKDKVGSFNYPNGDRDWGILVISPKSCEKGLAFVEQVITHELIHAAIGDNTQNGGGHGGKFNALAEAMGIPEKYRD
jgi:hypothetical protein